MVVDLIVWLILLIALVTPVTLRADLRWVGSAEALIALRFWGIGPDLRWRLERTRQGHRLIRLDKSGAPKPRPRQPSVQPTTLLRATLRGNHARQLLFRGLSLQQLDIALSVSLNNAARTALTAGTLQSLWRALPCQWRRRARLQVRPDFLNQQGGVQARCMVFSHLGTLLITAAMLLLSYAMERAAHPAHQAKEA